MRHGSASRQQWWRMGLALAVIGLLVVTMIRARRTRTEVGTEVRT